MVRGFLLDLDGTVYDGGQPIPGAPEAIVRLKQMGYALRFVTNTTSRDRAALVDKLNGMGVTVTVNDIFAPPYAAARYLRKEQASAMLLLTESARQEFGDVPTGGDRPDTVVVGDMGEQWTFAAFNRAFRALMDGAGLIALGMSRYWRTADGKLSLDTGPFVAALQFASGVEPIVLGKPALPFFEMARLDLGLEPDEIAMVGDDIEGDVGGAQRAGMTGILVRTGKFREADLRGEVRPDMILDSLAELPAAVATGSPPSPPTLGGAE
ncbi:MAG: TIGR01458 family HAD-type hydrolase [Chloroflexi bacterium]|nr:TIGR01458 family HAD-type hydrolase [Chloroflexota bacterium]